MNYDIIIAAFGGTGLAVAFLWSILNKLNKGVVRDQAEANIYHITKEEITRLANLVKTLSADLEATTIKMRQIEEDAHQERTRCEHELKKVTERLDDLQAQVEHQRRQDELGRTGEIDRRRGVDRRQA